MARDFKINITGDASGVVGAAGQGAGALNNLTDATKKGTAANEEHHKSFLHVESSGRAFHKALHQITELSPAAGLAMRAFLSPTTTLIMASVMALQELRREEEEAKKGAEEAGSAAAAAWAAMSAAAEEAGTKSAESAAKFKEQFEHLAEAQRSAKAQTEEIIKQIALEESALQRLLKVHETFDLARATTDEQREAIRTRYAGLNQEEKETGMAARLTAKEAELGAAEARKPALEAAMKAAIEAEEKQGGKGSELREDILTRQADRERLKKQLAEASTKLEKATPGTEAYGKANRDLGIARNALFETDEIEGRDKERLEALHEERVKAEKRVQDNEAIIQARRAELPGAREAFATERRVGGVEVAYGATTTGEQLGTHITQGMAHAAASGDIGGFAAGMAALATWPLQMRALFGFVMQADAEMKAQIRAIQQRIGSTQAQVNGAQIP